MNKVSENSATGTNSRVLTKQRIPNSPKVLIVLQCGKKVQTECYAWQVKSAGKSLFIKCLAAFVKQRKKAFSKVGAMNAEREKALKSCENLLLHTAHIEIDEFSSRLSRFAERANTLMPPENSRMFPYCKSVLEAIKTFTTNYPPKVA